jgi:hypothetical protein
MAIIKNNNNSKPRYNNDIIIIIKHYNKQYSNGNVIVYNFLNFPFFVGHDLYKKELTKFSE